MYVCIYLSVCTWIYLNSLITHVNTHTNTQTLLCVLQGFLTKNLSRTVIQLLTHIFKNHSVTDWKSRRRMLQIGLLLSEIPWVCLACRDLHRPFKFVIKAVWNKKMMLCSWRQTKAKAVWNRIMLKVLKKIMECWKCNHNVRICDLGVMRLKISQLRHSNMYHTHDFVSISTHNLISKREFKILYGGWLYIKEFEKNARLYICRSL